jgi:hypothetical protein
MHRKSLALALFLFMLAVPFSWGVQHEYSSAKIVDEQRKTREKVDMYLVNTPVTSAVPYFEITVRLDQTDYVAEYTPRHPEEDLPQSWVVGADVSVRMEKHALFLKRSDGSDMRWTLLKRIPVKAKAE